MKQADGASEPADDRLALDFANQWSQRGEAENNRAYSDLVLWAQEVGEISGAQGARLRREAEVQPAAAAAVLGSAFDLGDAIHTVFTAIAAGRDPEDRAVDGLNRALAAALPQLRLRRGELCCTWIWSGPEDALDTMLWPVIRSAADLLTSDRLDRVRECASASCSWLFIDTSRNRSRKWCDMAVCGNRAKANRYYTRHRRQT